MKLLITTSLVLFVLICYLLIRINKKKYSQKNDIKHLNIIRFLVIILVCVPFFIVSRLPESLNHPVNGLVMLIVLIFGWLLIPSS